MLSNPNKRELVMQYAASLEQAVKQKACQRRSKNLPNGGVKVGHFGQVVLEPFFS
jgi:hypothetical protein